MNIRFFKGALYPGLAIIVLVSLTGGYSQHHRKQKELQRQEILGYFHEYNRNQERTRERSQENGGRVFIANEVLERHSKYREQRRKDFEARPFLMPVSGRMTSGFGPRRDPITRRGNIHNGIDIAAPRGTPIYAVADGIVEVRTRNSWHGKNVILSHGGGMTTYYCHMSRFEVKKRGVPVKRGELIGYVGRTGKATGSHLHFEVRIDNKPKNPRNYLVY